MGGATRRPDSSQMRRFATSRVAGGALLALTAVFAVCAVEFSLHADEGLRAFLDDWVFDNAVLAAAALCVLRGVLRSGDRAAWLLIGAALGAWGGGDTLWTLTVADRATPPFPSIADAGYLALYPLAYVAIFLLLRSRIGSLRTSLWLDGVIGGLAVASVGTAIVFEAVLHTIGGSPAAVATNLAYPLADLTLIALVVWSLGVTGWRPGRTWGLIAAGLLAFSVSDSLYLYETAVGRYGEGGFTDLGWLGGAVLLAWAAWQPREPRLDVDLDGWSLAVMPVVFGLVALGVLAYDHFEQVNALPLALACGATVAVIARMGLAFAENVAMIRGSRLEARTDVLTGLGNRRKLYGDLEQLGERGEAVLVLFDLNGFKAYNDSFGHPAGDALLARLGRNLAASVAGRGAAYRLGGDEFCIVVPRTADEAELVVGAAAEALSEHGDAFSVTAAWGSVVVPTEAAGASDALRLADERMYLDKRASRRSVVRLIDERILLAAVEELRRNAGTPFEPVLVEALVELLAERGVARLALAS
jgi:diguanylate cyclase (GGDEF)-like protein